MFDGDFSKDLLINVVMSGGTTMFEGTGGRMVRCAAPAMNIKFVTMAMVCFGSGKGYWCPYQRVWTRVWTRVQPGSTDRAAAPHQE